MALPPAGRRDRPCGALAGASPKPSPAGASTAGVAAGTAPFAPTRRTSTSAAVSVFAGLGVRALDEEHRAAGHGGAQPHGAAHARPVRAHLDLVAVAGSRAGRRRRGRARRPGAGAGSAARGRGRPPWRPTAAARCPCAARPRPAAGARRRHVERRGLPRLGAERRGGLRPRRPAHAAAADLVEREPGEEGDGLEEQRGRVGGPVADAEVDGRRAAPRRRSPASPRARRSPSAPSSGRGRPMAGRSRCTRPSGCTSVPSFSA